MVFFVSLAFLFIYHSSVSCW